MRNGGILKMFGDIFGKEEISKKDIAKGVIDMVFKDYENQINNLKDDLIKESENINLLQEDNNKLQENINLLQEDNKKLQEKIDRLEETSKWRIASGYE